MAHFLAMRRTRTAPIAMFSAIADLFGTNGWSGARRWTCRARLLILPLALSACGGGSGNTETASPIQIIPAVTSAPTISIAFATAKIPVSGASALSWTSSHADSCSGSGAWTGGQALSGQSMVSPSVAGSYTYTLSCTGAGGTSSEAATLVVTGAAVPAGRPDAWVPPYGLYVGNPNGNDAAAMTRFQTDWDGSVRQLQRAPQFFGTFTDFNQDWKSWPSNASWFAWSFNQSRRTSGMKPIIGIKLSTNSYWNRQADAFREIIAGKHDQVYRDVVTAWRDHGFKELRFRISYEFNGNFMPDNFGSTPEMLELWKNAFAHVADVMHGVPNVKVLIVWNPANINWSANSVAAAYPGDRYVDIISSDLYSTLYPTSLHDWSGGPKAPNVAEWAKNPANRIHFWDYPGATEWTRLGNGWGTVQALDFALERGKPFAISETGVGGDNVKNGLSDDPLFPNYLSTRLRNFVARGGIVDHVIIWDYDASDGKWRFTGRPEKAATASAWTGFVNSTGGL